MNKIFYLLFILLLIPKISNAANCIEMPGTIWDAGTAGTCQYTDVCYENEDGETCQEASCTEAGSATCCKANNSTGIGCFESASSDSPPLEPLPAPWFDKISNLLEEIIDNFFH